MFCVYVTTYEGTRMPRFYVGSTSIERIVKGYCGSVRSKKWKYIWDCELRDNPHLFEVKIIREFETRVEATHFELEYQKQNNVVRSIDWINEGYAQPGGYAGRDVTGKNNPNFGGQHTRVWIENNPEKASERSRKSALTQWGNPETAQKKVEAMRGKKKTRKTLTEEEWRELQKQKAQKRAEKNAYKIYYNGAIYLGWNDLKEKTGMSKYLFMKNKLGKIQ